MLHFILRLAICLNGNCQTVTITQADLITPIIIHCADQTQCQEYSFLGAAKWLADHPGYTISNVDYTTAPD